MVKVGKKDLSETYIGEKLLEKLRKTDPLKWVRVHRDNVYWQSYSIHYAIDEIDVELMHHLCYLGNRFLGDAYFLKIVNGKEELYNNENSAIQRVHATAVNNLDEVLGRLYKKIESAHEKEIYRKRIEKIKLRDQRLQVFVSK